MQMKMKDVKTMTDKAYIVANEQQEQEVLEKLGEKVALWGTGKNATDFILFRTFPYVIYCNGDKYIFWEKLGDLDVDKIIAFDGRKEEQMSEKYVVSQEFMNELKEWKVRGSFVSVVSLGNLPSIINKWRVALDNKECNNRLIAIIRWVNGEDVFEVEKPKKWVVRSKERDDDGNYGYVDLIDNAYAAITNIRLSATRFDTKEEAESWANSHQEVVEVEE